MMHITVAGRDWTIEPTGYRTIPYTLTCGTQVRRGKRAPHDPDMIIVEDLGARYVGAFRESTRREVVRR